MANEQSLNPFMPSGNFFPYQFYRGVVPAGTTVNCALPANPSTSIITTVDVGIVTAISSGYVQFYDAGTGQTIWVSQPNGLEAAYASWRGMYLQDFPGGSSSYCRFFNNTTASIGVSIAGFCWSSLGQNGWNADIFPPT